MRVVVVAAAIFAAHQTQVLSQDISQPSLGGDRAAYPIYANTVPASRYNIKVGPTKWLLSASMGAAYNSNVNVSEENPIGSFVFSPRVGMGVFWPITKANKLRLNVSLGYDYYASDPAMGGQTILIDPDTDSNSTSIWITSGLPFSIGRQLPATPWTTRH